MQSEHASHTHRDIYEMQHSISKYDHYTVARTPAEANTILFDRDIFGTWVSRKVDVATILGKPDLEGLLLYGWTCMTPEREQKMGATYILVQQGCTHHKLKHVDTMLVLPGHARQMCMETCLSARSLYVPACARIRQWV